jgi:TonB family protein
METRRFYLTLGLCFSLAIHGVLFGGFFFMGSQPVSKRDFGVSLLVPVTERPPMEKPSEKPAEKLKVPEIKKEIVKKTEKTTARPLPEQPVLSEQKAAEKTGAENDAKPVFGMKVESLSDVKTGGMSVRQGNTVMKEQEAEATEPSRVKPLARSLVTVPVFELSTMPTFRQRVKPDYPESLKHEEREGEAVLSAIIDEQGRVTEVTVIRSTHPKFAQAAVAALKRSRFSPATRNGASVATVLEDLVYSFVLER